MVGGGNETVVVTFRCERTLGVSLCFPSHLRQGLCSCPRQASLAVSFWGLYCLLLLSHYRNSGVIDSCYCACLYVGSGDLSSGPQACSSNALVTKPSPQPWMAEVCIRSCLWNCFLRFPSGSCQPGSCLEAGILLALGVHLGGLPFSSLEYLAQTTRRKKALFWLLAPRIQSTTVGKARRQGWWQCHLCG